MTLVNRVSAFFLLALALALVGYSFAFYSIVRSHLYGQFDQDLQNALQILAAAVEVEQDDVKWDPAERSLELDSEQVLGRVQWLVTNEQNQVIDHSRELKRADPADAPLFDFVRSHPRGHGEAVAVGDWRFLQKVLVAPKPKPITLREPHEYSTVIVTVAASLATLTASMRQLALLVTALPLLIWLVAAAIGRWYCRHALQPLRAMAGRARSMTGADFDLRMPVDASGDELADLGRAFNQLLDHLQQAFEHQRRFTGDAAHQLRTPLTVLQGQIDVALRRPRQAEEYRNTLNVLKAQVAEFRQSVESLLFLARASDDALPPNAENLELSEWFPRYLERWRTHPRGGDLKLQVDAPTCVTASAPLVTQLFDNLVDNALKYSQPGSPVQLSVSRRNGQVSVVVADQGIGIAPQDVGAIFDPFFRSTSARQTGTAGTGLGLAVAARIAAALGGVIECQSELGKGSRFIFSIEEGRHAPNMATDAATHPA